MAKFLILASQRNMRMKIPPDKRGYRHVALVVPPEKPTFRVEDLSGVCWRRPIKRWFFTKADELSSGPLPQSVNLKTALTSVLISGINVTSYPSARPQTPCLRAGLRDNPESPANTTYVEFWWVDSVVESFRLVSH
jgi:hypothetical protein